MMWSTQIFHAFGVQGRAVGMSMPSILYGIRCVDTGIKPAMREIEENRVNFIVYFMVHIVRQTEVLKDIVIMCHDDIYTNRTFCPVILST